MIEFFVFSHTQFTLWPEMVMYPWLFNHGFLLYRDIANPYFPLLTWMLSFMTKFFGYDTGVYVAFTWSFIFASQLFFIYVGTRIFKSKIEIIYAFLIYVLLLLAFEGNGLWFDLICTLPLMVSFYAIIRQKYFLSGLSLAVGILLKQTVIWPIIGVLLYLLLEKRYKKMTPIALPILIALIFVCLIFIWQGIFPDFYHWTINLALGGMQKSPEFVQWPTRRNIIIMVFAFGLPFVYFQKLFKDQIFKLAAIFFVSTFLFAFPRFGYFHLVATLPFFAILSTHIFRYHKKVAVIQLMLTVVITLFLIQKNPNFSVRFFTKSTIQKGSALERYFMHQKLPHKPWIDNFPWYKEKS